MEAEFITGNVDSLARWPKLALDLEGNSFHSYFDRVCLVQISTPDDDFLFDPLEAGIPDGLRGLLEDPERTWVLHGADYDVLSLQRDFSLVLGGLFDTMIAARFLGAEGLGLKALLEAELGVQIEKGEQRSDWSRRPLTDQQLGYAMADTRHLLPLAEQLEQKLRDRGRWEWQLEECELLRLKPHVPKPFDPDGWMKIKGIRDLDAPGKRAARAVYLWRDQRARRSDRAPFRVLSNDVIRKVAEAVDQRGPRALRNLRGIKGFPKNIREAQIRETVEAALADDRPIRDKPRRKNRGSERRAMDADSKARLAALKACRVEVSSRLGLDAGFLASTTLLEAIARERVGTMEALLALDGMTRWRAEAIGADLLATYTPQK